MKNIKNFKAFINENNDEELFNNFNDNIDGETLKNMPEDNIDDMWLDNEDIESFNKYESKESDLDYNISNNIDDNDDFILPNNSTNINENSSELDEYELKNIFDISEIEEEEDNN